MTASKNNTTISIRVPNKLKEEMNKIKINWSEYLRIAIEEKIKEEKLKKLWVEIENIKNEINNLGGMRRDN
ncbi:hypothetical protein DRP05_15405 [Archaeoglobales archaeon]|nr:MAG: hypothetical protein DRP05_15405 [Archaeoglobales archaeon]